WPGGAVPEGREQDVADTLQPDGLYPVFLSEAEVEGHYTRISNETLWPLFHYFVGRLRFSDDAWASYVTVNNRFADEIAAVAPPPGGARVAHRLPPGPPPRRASLPASRPRNRLLPARAVPVFGDLPPPAGPARTPPRHARRRLHRLPHG